MIASPLIIMFILLLLIIIIVLSVILINKNKNNKSKQSNPENADKKACQNCEQASRRCPTCPPNSNCPTCPSGLTCPPNSTCSACPNCPTQGPENPDKILNWSNSVIYLAGFTYDHSQNIYTTRQDALQRLGGYTAAYDNISTRIYMVIDIEPIKFRYNNKNYMIELWKGQYFASTGCEIGLYNEVVQDPGRYFCATDDEMLQMSYSLVDTGTGREIFNRNGVHWWLTGFKPGVFTDPSKLSIENIKIQFKDNGMAQAFYNTLTGYFNNPNEYKYQINGNTVSFRWHITKFPQPNSSLRPSHLDYDLNLTNSVNKIMKGDFTPIAVNNKVIEVIAFLETDDNVDSFIDWFSGKDNNDNRVNQIVSRWDSEHGNDNMSNILVFLKYLKQSDNFQAYLKLMTVMRYLCGGNTHFILDMLKSATGVDVQTEFCPYIKT